MKNLTRMHLSLAAFLPALALSILAGCGEASSPGDAPTPENDAPVPVKDRKLIVLHAGSLSIPFKEVSALFEKQNPGVTVQSESAGSRDTARKVSDLNRPCDVLGSADYKVVENLLMPEHADFNIRFATNEMAIAYTDKSKYADEITSKNWHEILMKEGVTFGRADPNSDPCGYRTVMLFDLAQKHFGVDGLAKRLKEKDGKRFIRPKETDLLALLEASEIDYLPIYRSVAMQHGLKTVRLPDEMNLRSSAHEDLYATAIVEVTGKNPGETITRKGAPIVYSITIPKNAPSRDLAVRYLDLLLSKKGQAIMDRNGQSPIVPAITGELDVLPDDLKKHCVKPE